MTNLQVFLLPEVSTRHHTVPVCRSVIMLLLLVTVVATTIAVSVNQSCGSPRGVVDTVPAGSLPTDSGTTSIRSVRRHGGGGGGRLMPPDTAGFFFGKRAGLGMHPHANNLLFGKRTAGDDDTAGGVDEATAAETSESFKLDVCAALRSTCSPVWSAEDSNDDNGY